MRPQWLVIAWKCYSLGGDVMGLFRRKAEPGSTLQEHWEAASADVRNRIARMESEPASDHERPDIHAVFADVLGERLGEYVEIEHKHRARAVLRPHAVLLASDLVSIVARLGCEPNAIHAWPDSEGPTLVIDADGAKFPNMTGGDW